jgi:hypothetical protein
VFWLVESTYQPIREEFHMRELMVKVPFERLVVTAKRLGSQDTDECPPTDAPCWHRRGLVSYLPGDSLVDNECTECWLTYMMKGK